MVKKYLVWDFERPKDRIETYMEKGEKVRGMETKAFYLKHILTEAGDVAFLDC
jgi:hypothetical protein